MVIAFNISAEIDASIVLKTFKKAYKSRNKPKELLFHSDQGCQYTAYDFKKYLRTSGVKQSFSTLGSPYDNAVAESFFASMKKEEIYRHIYETKEELIDSVKEYIEFFNYERPHQKLGYRTPSQFESDYLSS
jgi:transposase InsO family protein